MTLPAPGRPAESSGRDESIDFMRGGAMVLMALDHVRHFFSDSLSIRATDLEQTNAGLFLTRWMTHFCAPVFVFLAGTAAFLATTGPRAKTKSELSRFLLTRGSWLIVLELTVVRCAGWTFNFDYRYVMFGVIWALGWSMIALAGLIHVPRGAILAFAIVVIAGHKAFDHLRPKDFGALGWLWKVLHVPRQLEPFAGVRFKVAYPLVPWIAVMAAGYAAGALWLHPPEKRRKGLAILGLVLTGAFLTLRAANVYGDPRPWSAQTSALFTALSFLNCDKYPPSLLFLLMTLGPAFCVLAVADFLPRAARHPFVIFGRVPLFYYLLHLPVIHLLAMVFAHVRYGRSDWLRDNPPSGHGPPFPLPDGYGFSLPVVYGIWLGVIVALYPTCVWFARIKRRGPNLWLTYL